MRIESGVTWLGAGLSRRPAAVCLTLPAFVFAAVSGMARTDEPPRRAVARPPADPVIIRAAVYTLAPPGRWAEALAMDA
ncbi:MAG: hypothetical protein HYY48_04770 [Gammaproteobacteria bacterium]|nr:hypothetical protein [Gammaproteobacteria bacterium]